MADYLDRQWRTVDAIKGPLVVVRREPAVGYGDILRLDVEGGGEVAGQVIELSERYAVAQLFGSTGMIGPVRSTVRFTGEQVTLPLSPLMLGRMFNGSAVPADGGPPVPAERRRPVEGSAINPVRRELPRDFIQTGISAIDGLNTLVRGQKLPIFSGAGLPANEIATRIIAHAGVEREGERFALVFAGMGVTRREADYFARAFDESGALEHSVVFLNTADDPVIERILTPRFALTAAEYLAFTLDYQVLVVMTDMTHYCNALREVASSREEIPGRRGYPGYLYTDLAGLYERAGRIKGKPGSLTQVPILTMPDDDITHPVPDLTGYITEGQIVLDRGLHRRGIFPPINVLPSLSRLMNRGIGEGRTRAGHREWADQLYLCHARGMEQRRIAAIIGEEGLSEIDRAYLAFADRFEELFVGQQDRARPMEETFAAGWELLAGIPREELVRVSREQIDRWLPKEGEEHGQG